MAGLTMSRPLSSPLPSALGPCWQTALAERVRHLWWLKLAGVCAFMWVFFIGYFHTLRNPTGAVFVMPLTWLDHALPFQPYALWVYVSLWLYVGIAPGLLLSFRELLIYGLWIGVLCVSGLAVFHWWPTAVPRLVVDVSAHAGFVLLKGVDAVGNACPSLHVATAAFTAFWVHYVLHCIGTPPWLRWANWAWVGAIVWSTMATKQHVAWDVAAGLLLAGSFAMLSLRGRRR
jgi:hypothetical protein